MLLMLAGVPYAPRAEYRRLMRMGHEMVRSVSGSDGARCRYRRRRRKSLTWLDIAERRRFR